MIGDPANQASAGARFSRSGRIGIAVTAIAYLGNYAMFHLPGVQACSLGAGLTQTPWMDAIGSRSGPALAVAGDTLPQFIRATPPTSPAAGPRRAE